MNASATFDSTHLTTSTGRRAVGKMGWEAVMPINHRERVRTEGQQQRMDRRATERTRNDGRKMNRAAKRSQAYA